MRKEIKSFVIVAICSSMVLSSEAKGGEDFVLGTDFKSVPVYWKRPVILQAQQNNNFSLYPETCGQCHKEQHHDWKMSLHSKAVGPGLLGQLSPFRDPQFATSCYYCHAPMEEQSEVKAGAGVKGQGAEEYIKNPSFDNKLKLSAVSCSVCHLREGKVYGPPAQKVRSQELGVRSKKEKLHNSFIEEEFFEKAEFCAACHQLNEGYELNGKLLVNTYREWKESIYGKNNVTCQNCHMPDRKHLWRGIHDREMVLRGVRIESIRHDNGARLTITNSGVGHYFPAYATPLVEVKGFMLDKNGKVIQGSLKEAYIGRKLSLDLSEEIFDTRIPPQKSFEFDYNPPIPPLVKGGKGGFSNKIAFEIWVYPDEFYSRFYKAVLKSKGRDFKREELEKAIGITDSSGYRLFGKIM